MADKIDKLTRSKIMSRIRSTNTQIELIFRKALFQHGLRGYRVHRQMLGNPDVTFMKHKLAIFIDGDFWHGYNWKVRGKVPPKKYWQEKIQRTIDRDKVITRKLRKKGWKVLRFWEHQVKDNLAGCIKKVRKEINL